MPGHYQFAGMPPGLGLEVDTQRFMIFCEPRTGRLVAQIADNQLMREKDLWSG